MFTCMFDDLGIVDTCVGTIVGLIMYWLADLIVFVFYGYCEMDLALIVVHTEDTELGLKGLG